MAIDLMAPLPPLRLSHLLFATQLLSFLLPVGSHGQEPTGKYLTSWQLSGPHQAGPALETAGEQFHLSGFDAAPLGDEAALQPAAGAQGWLAYTAPRTSGAIVDLDEALSKSSNVFAYAYTVINVSTPQAALLALGTNDGARVWLNGEQLYDYPQPRGLSPDRDLLPVQLREGANHLLLKVEERGGEWGFTCRFLPLNGEYAEKLRLFAVTPRGDEPPQLRFLHAGSIIGSFVTGAALRVVDPREPATPIWEGAWNAEPLMDLPVPTKDFRQLTLVADATLAGNLTHQSETAFHAGVRTEHTLFEGGKSEYSIVLSQNASESEQWAAQELQHWLQEISGATLPILVTDTTPNFAIVFDSSKASPEEESFSYATDGPHIRIAGGSQRGVMYGVFSLLEREFGCRWYTPTVTVAPKRDRYTFTTLQHSESPTLRVRNDFYFEAFDPTWAARNRVNGAMSLREQPGGVEGYWGVHTFYPFLPPEQYFEAHPEYFSLIDGKRIWERAQLCLTNPAVLDIVTESLRKIMREQPNYLIYDVSQNDWYNPCQCDNCQAIAKAEGSESGPNLWFVNQVAERVAQEFPTKFIGTLAYQYTRTPPKTLRPRDNVIIRLCSIECCFAHDFTTCPVNKPFLDDLKGWAAIAPRLYIWDYVVNFSHYPLPYPNFNVLQPNIQTFIDHNAIGIMEQGAYQSRGGEFAELRLYVLSKLLWDSEADVQETINDFMYGYYGRSGQYVRQYLDLLHAQLTPDTHIHLGLEPTDALFSEKFIEQATAIFAQADAVADAPEIARRVDMAHLPVLYLHCKRNPSAAKADGSYARLKQIVELENITHFAESGEPHKQAFHAAVEAAQ